MVMEALFVAMTLCVVELCDDMQKKTKPKNESAMIIMREQIN